MSKIISVASGFQYSVNIGYDLNNDDKLKNFIPTRSALELLEETSDRMIDSEEMYASIVAYFGSNVEKYCNAMKEESLCKIHLQL